MTEIGESVAVPAMPANEKEEEPVGCEWNTCNGYHKDKPQYPKDGNVERDNNYKDNWVSAGLEPWDLYGPGNNSKATLEEYRNETEKGQHAEAAAAMEHPEYHTQKHHLISINFFDDVPDLSNNAELIGYDVNHKNNGMCLPSHKVDIVQHDLQCHRAGHSKEFYNKKVMRYLRQIEKKCMHYCNLERGGGIETQKNLINDLNMLSERAKRKIIEWQWLVRKDAHAERTESYQRYEKLSAE